jgi:cellulose synthase/poly-beta-1,6-N-acetylglucosamine synthase-like glycosyltransferase
MTVQSIVWYPLSAFLAGYALLLLYLLVKSLKSFSLKAADSAVKWPPVSVILPFKNEAIHLAAILKSLATQDYKGPYEVVLVNDGSGDAFRTAIDSSRMAFPSLRINLMDSAFQPERDLTGKQQALDTGAGAASYGLLAFTDADMELAPFWLSMLVASLLSTGASIAYGHTAIKHDGRNAFARLQALQLGFLFATAYAFHRAGIRGSCMGNNLLVTRDAYQAVGGQEGIGYSIVEDRALLCALVRAGFTATPSVPFTPSAWTFAVSDVKGFMHQMLRWARGGFSLRSGLLPIGLLLLAQNVSLLLALAGALPPAFLAPVLINFLLTWLYASMMMRRCGSTESAALFPALYLFMLAETAVFGLSLPFIRTIVWKDGRIRVRPDR